MNIKQLILSISIIPSLCSAGDHAALLREGQQLSSLAFHPMPLAERRHRTFELVMNAQQFRPVQQPQVEGQNDVAAAALWMGQVAALNQVVRQAKATLLEAERVEAQAIQHRLDNHATALYMVGILVVLSWTIKAMEWAGWFEQKEKPKDVDVTVPPPDLAKQNS